MLSDHYSFPIEDLRQHEPQPADLEWRAARRALSDQRAQKPEPRRLSHWFRSRRFSRTRP